MGRDFFVRETCEQRPFRCACGSQAAPVVDTFIDLPAGYGRLYLCDHCFQKAAVAREWIGPDAQTELAEQIHRLRHQVKGLEDDLEQARSEQVQVVKVTDLKALLEPGNASTAAV